MIQSAWFEEFRALRRVSVDLERLTVFVGPNGSGKTSILEGIHYLLWLTAPILGRALSDPLRGGSARNSRTSKAMKIGLAFDADPVSSLELTIDVPDGEPVHAVVRAESDGESSEFEVSVPGIHATSSGILAARARAGRTTSLSLSPNALAAPHYSEEKQPRIESSGHGLASVIADLAGNDPERKERICDAVRRVVPSVRRIRTERAKVTRRETEYITVGDEQVARHRDQTYWGQSVLIDTTSGDSIPLSAASEGTVLVIGLMTVLHGAQRPRTLLMDDLDRALHPKAQQDLVAVLRTAMADDPELQILATSHSPFLLDALEHDEVRLTTLADDGSVLCGALRDHPEFEQWRSLVKPGELWTSGLENWLRAAPGATAA